MKGYISVHDPDYSQDLFAFCTDQVDELLIRSMRRQTLHFLVFVGGIKLISNFPGI